MAGSLTRRSHRHALRDLQTVLLRPHDASWSVHFRAAEYRRIFPGLTVEENLILGFMQCPRRSRAEDRRRLDAIYTRFARLGERRTQMGTTLSGGEGLAPLLVDEIFRLMEGLRRDGIPILLVEQNMRRAVELVQHFYVLERGSVVLHGDGTNREHRDALVRQLSV